MGNQGTGIEFNISSVEGYWRNTHPSLVLKGIEAQASANSDIQFSLDEVVVEFDLISSILNLSPRSLIFACHRWLSISVQSISLITNLPRMNPRQVRRKVDRILFKQLDNLLLRQLNQFYLYDSRVTYKAVSGEVRELELDNLKWENDGNYHLAEGLVSIAGTTINSLSVSANFEDHGSLVDISGDFFVQAENIRIGQWLTTFLRSETGIEEGHVSFDSWLTLKRSRPRQRYDRAPTFGVNLACG